AMRRRWARRTGNDGKARVAVPLDADMSPSDTGATVTPDIAPDVTPDKNNDIRGIRDDAVTPWRELADALRAQVADLTRRLDEAGAERIKLVSLVETVSARHAPDPSTVDALHVRAAAAEGKVAELQALIDVDMAQL